MSDFRAIAAVTTTLRSLLLKGLGIQEVTARSLDNARKDKTTDQVNLFLYQALPDAAWRNMDMPRQVKPGETGYPPLPLTLYYLLTAYSDDDDDIDSHRLLGRAMSILHDHSLLGRNEIKAATENTRDLEESNLHEQIERVRITLQPLTLEEMSKLWSPFQTQYRFSVAYQVSVVLIESTRPVKSPLPVLQRGQEDRGVIAVAGALPILEEVRVPVRGTFAGIEDIRLARAVPSAQLGDEIALLGRNLAGDSVTVMFKSQHSTATFAPTQIVQNTDQLIIAKLQAPGDPADQNSPTATWPAGFYTARVMVKRNGEPDRFSNELAFSLAPTIRISPTAARAGDIELTVTCAPMVQPEQRVSLLFNNGEILAKPITAKTDQPKFGLTAVAQGEYVVRLRVDGVDSIPIDRQATTPQFADDQKLKVT
ncbi:DUF4255 domain-containing protein [bacterium]|nr:DUF4255 domain-containing protein [bacterium]